MSADASDRTPIDPDAVAQHPFAKVRKGYDTDEVRAYLVGLASEIRDLQRVHDDLSRRLVEVERRAADPRELDEESVTQLLGEETARVLVDARKAATDIRTKAEEASAATRTAASEEAAETRAAAEQYAESVRTLADEGEARIRADADAYATELRERSERETTEQRAAADAYATEVRDTADREVAEQRATAQAEVDELTEQARTVLADRTAEAEAAATTVRADADQYRDGVRAEADAYAATTRADAEAEAQRLVDDAREQGRAMVAEARDYRERVITDLAERRRAARDDLDHIAKTRDALAVTLTDVVTQIERSHRSLQELAIDPSTTADGGADRRFLEVDDTATAVAVGEVPGGPAVEAELDEPEVDGVDEVDPAPDADAADEVNEDEEDLEDEPPVWSDDAADPESTADPESVEDESVEDVDESDEVEAVEIAADVEVAEADVAGTDAGDEEAVDGTAPGIDDLFARIRAEREAGSGEDDPSTGSAPVAEAPEEPAPTADVTPDEADSGDEGPEAAEEVGEATEDELVLDRRDATTDEIERQLARRLKRVLSDEQNEALHDLRNVKGAPTAEAVLPSEADHRDRYRAALLEDLRAAERAGAAFYGEAPTLVADVDDIADELSSDLVRQVRGRLERSFETSDDPEDVADDIRTLYREWKTQRIAEAARHFVVTAFARGVAEAGVDGARFRWLVDHGGAAAPDCDDNALAGPVAKGEPFPTGDLCPPVHPGCRCLVVPVTD